MKHIQNCNTALLLSDEDWWHTLRHVGARVNIRLDDGWSLDKAAPEHESETKSPFRVFDVFLRLPKSGGVWYTCTKR
jgi:hypothetical protein